MSRLLQPVQLEDIATEQSHNNRYSFMDSPVDGHSANQYHADSNSAAQHHQYQTIVEQARPAQYQPAKLYPNEKERHLQEEGIIPTYSKYPPPDQHPANFAPYAEPVEQYAVQPVVHSPIQSPLHSPLQSPLHSPLQSPVYTQQPVLQYPYQYQQQMHQQQEHQMQMQMQMHMHMQMQMQQQQQQQYQQQQYHQQQQQQQEDYSQPPSSPGPLPIKTNPEMPTRSDTMTVGPDENPLRSPKLPSFPPPAATDSSRRPTSEDVTAFHQPGQIMHPVQEVRGGGWTYGMCDCSNNFGACLLGLICPCILYGKTQYRLNRKSKAEDPTNMLGYETCNGSCTGMAILCGCQWIFSTIQRRRTRKAYGIDGDFASDCVRGTCCCCCTLIQNEKEIQKREEKRSRVAYERGATLTSPYTTPAPMTFPPPPK
ncbi:uncharacterized protein N7483_010313 [Penicillium malachiteum]|uniref:uncharacterized protein n=1 Tax=Penicillium malachiteum TaxID=1324776 RepID=UPI0025491018|nr:uncharacterized protein N7483_010313 [Penicillium malachiteum]KAJ5713132.1 hypothetical protein N7483_010313 [Penicillium malachiteum]